MPEPPSTFQFVADRGDAALRLDRILVRRVTVVSGLSRSVAQRWIEAGAVLVDGRPAHRAAGRVVEGASIDVALPAAVRLRVRPAPEPGALDVIYEDAALMIVNKPAGVVVHPSYKQTSGTILNAVLWRIREQSGETPGIVTRLDKDTSGLVLVALRADVHTTLQRDAAAGRVQKSYLAVVEGRPHPREGHIRLALARDPADRRRMVAAEGGAPSETRYTVLSDDQGSTREASVVRCELVTGRTHQIRVHLATAGWPIIGDRTYGQPDARIDRQALHAAHLSLPHPVTRVPLDVQAPLPDDMRRLIANVGAETVT